MDPGDLLRMVLVRRPQDVALVRPGGAEQPLEVHAGDDVLVGAVAVVAPHLGIERLVAGREHDRADLDFDLLRRLVEVDGVVLAHAGADRAGLVLQVQAGVVDVGDQRHGLREIDVHRLVQRQVLVERVGDLDRAVFDADGAAGALVLVDVARLLGQRHREVAGRSLHAGDLGVGHDLDVGVPVALDELGRLDAHRAVVGREGLVQLRHLPADGGGLLHQVDLEAGRRQVQRRLDAADAAADHHHVAAQVIIGAQETLAHRFVGVIEGVFQCVCHVMTP